MTIWVRSTDRSYHGQAVVVEEHPAHPPHPVTGRPVVSIVHGRGDATEVGMSPLVAAALADGRLVQVDAPGSGTRRRSRGAEAATGDAAPADAGAGEATADG